MGVKQGWFWWATSGDPARSWLIAWLPFGLTALPMGISHHFSPFAPPQFNIGSVKPCTSPSYAMYYASPTTQTAREVLR
jgi:hypothetical protein